LNTGIETANGMMTTGNQKEKKEGLDKKIELQKQLL